MPDICLTRALQPGGLMKRGLLKDVEASGERSRIDP